MCSETCEKCGAALRVGDWPFCPHPAGPKHRPFIPFDVDHGDGKKTRIDSIQAADKLARESMSRYQDFDNSGNRRGAPMVVRAFHQDASNQDKNVFGEGPAGVTGADLRSRNIRGRSR